MEDGAREEGRMIPTYDDRQLGAVLVRCTVCARDYFMTQQRSICLRCQQDALTRHHLSAASGAAGSSRSQPEGFQR